MNSNSNSNSSSNSSDCVDLQVCDNEGGLYLPVEKRDVIKDPASKQMNKKKFTEVNNALEEYGCHVWFHFSGLASIQRPSNFPSMILLQDYVRLLDNNTTTLIVRVPHPVKMTNGSEVSVKRKYQVAKYLDQNLLLYFTHSCAHHCQMFYTVQCIIY